MSGGLPEGFGKIAQKSCVYLVGAGPGDPGLLTVKALSLIQQTDVVVYDRLVSAEILNLVPSGVCRIYVGKHNGSHPMPQQEINRLLARLANTGQCVVRLKGGDPFVFGRGGEEALYLKQLGIRCQIVPGITAATACSGYAGIPLTHRDYAHGVLFLSGHCKDGNLLEEQIENNLSSKSSVTLVIYMGLSHLPRIVTTLLRIGMSPDTPMALIERGTTAAQRRLLTTLDQAVDTSTNNHMQAPVLIIIGEVVELATSLDWFISEADSRQAQTALNL